MLIRFDDNAAVILNRKTIQEEHVFLVQLREIREKSFTKVVSLAPEVL